MSLRFVILRIAALAAVAGLPGSAQQTKPGAGAPAVLNQSGFTVTSNLTATPSSITFTSTDPDLGPVSGSSTATVKWTVSQGNNNKTWTLSVNATTANMTNCSTVPVSAITVTCATATVSGGSGTGTCSPAFNLSNTLQQVASGAEGKNTANYTVTINFTFTDLWKFVAATGPPCGVSLTYTANDP